MTAAEPTRDEFDPAQAAMGAPSRSERLLLALSRAWLFVFLLLLIAFFWITTPSGVWMARATQSGMLCVTRMNSMPNGPMVTRSEGRTVVSRARATSMPCSTSFGSTSASVSGVP